MAEFDYCVVFEPRRKYDVKEYQEKDGPQETLLTLPV